LTPFDIVANLDKLSARKQVISASAALQAFQKSADSLRATLSWQVIVRLERTTSKWKALSIDNATTAALISVLKLLVLRLRDEQKPIRNREPFYRLFIVVLEFSTHHARFSIEALQLIGYSVDYFGAECEHFLEENQNHYSIFLKIIENFHAVLRKYCIQGDVLALESAMRGAFRSRFIAPLAKAQAEKLWAEHDNFPSEIQKNLAVLTNRETDYIDPLAGIAGNPNSVAELQLASLLINAWETTEKDIQGQSLFKQMQVILKNNFGLELFGTIDSEVEFNSRLHESVSAIAGQKPPRFVRPGVKTESIAGSRILIKALVD
ncbi:MAG TPA: hypothetical protein VGN44_06370, partial [Candidatus Angelobacter sp.]